MRALPNLTVIEPADATQTRAAVAAIADYEGPVYLRLKRGEVPVLPDAPGRPFRIGQVEVVRDGTDVVIFACGLMVTLALAAAEQLKSEGKSIAVVNVATLKPLDAAEICRLAAGAGAVVTAENHSIIGGLGSAVAQALLAGGVSCRSAQVGIADTFAEGASPSYLFAKYGLSTEAIVSACRRLES
jgi:transketolase